MANLSIHNLHYAGSDLFSGSENFMSEISESDLAVVYGGRMDTPATDWCTTTKTIPMPTSPIVVIVTTIA